MGVYKAVKICKGKKTLEFSGKKGHLIPNPDIWAATTATLTLMPLGQVGSEGAANSWRSAAVIKIAGFSGTVTGGREKELPAKNKLEVNQRHPAFCLTVQTGGLF